LDLTKILAGPMASRFLAAYGADVLRIDPPWWKEPSLLAEVTLGKRCAGLDLRDAEDRRVFEGLLAQCDVFLHGYRADALEKLGFGAEERRALNPGMIDVSHNAYGWTGPWRNRRGYDSLVQMSSGIAEYGMRQYGADKPTPLPAQALDHATGYFLATAVIQGLARRRAKGVSTTARLSLSRTARLLVDHISDNSNTSIGPMTPDDMAPDVEATPWGELSRNRFPLEIPGCPAIWEYPVGQLRTSPAEFLDAA
jgi:crotonobetainyl-CoA:carnitine CoA-transferase CaiB-like acyl-CoA transferase